MRCRAAVHSSDARTVMRRVRGEAFSTLTRTKRVSTRQIHCSQVQEMVFLKAVMADYYAVAIDQSVEFTEVVFRFGISLKPASIGNNNMKYNQW